MKRLLPGAAIGVVPEFGDVPRARLRAARSRGDFTFSGTYSGNAFSDFLLGLPFQGRRTFPRNLFGIKYLWNEHFFFQDDWRVTSKLTVNLGLRYEYFSPPVEAADRQSNFDPVKGVFVRAASDAKPTCTRRRKGATRRPT